MKNRKNVSCDTLRDFDNFVKRCNENILKKFAEIFKGFKICNSSKDNVNIQIYSPLNELPICHFTPIKHTDKFKISKCKSVDNNLFSEILQKYGIKNNNIELDIRELEELSKIIFDLIPDEFDEKNACQDEIDGIDRDLEKNISLNECEKMGIVKIRLQQGKYRKRLLSKFKSKCLLCNINVEKMLIASHIKPYSVCNNYEKYDLNNGIILCANHDKLFDQHLISINNDGIIKMKKEVEHLTNLDYTKNIYEEFDGIINREMKDYFSFHYNKYMLNEL